MARYLVTGGCGFIGSHLCDALVAEGHGVRILDDLSTGARANAPPAAQLVVGDVADPDAVRGAIEGVDGCFHLAAVASVERSRLEWLATHRTNLTGAIAVLDAARGAKGGRPIPVVYASSAAVYGDSPDTPLREGSATRPLSAYGADKLGCELHARVAGATHGVPTSGLRFFNVYGPRQDPRSPYSGVISIFCERLLGRRPVTLHGDGGQTRDFVYVADVVDALRAAMERVGRAPVMNVCTGTPTSILTLAEAVGRLCGGPPEIVRAEARPGDIRVSLGDPTLMRRTLGLGRPTPLDEGLARTVGSLRRPGGRAA